MSTTVMIDEKRIQDLGVTLDGIEGQLSEDDRLTMLTVFALAGEAMDARVGEAVEVTGFTSAPVRVGIGVDVNGVLPSLGDGLLLTLAKGKKPKSRQVYLNYELTNAMISSY